MGDQIKKTVNPKNKGSDWTTVRIPLFFVDQEPQANNQDICDLQNLSYHKIKIELQRKKKKCRNTKNAKLLVKLKTTVLKYLRA